MKSRHLLWASFFAVMCLLLVDALPASGCDGYKCSQTSTSLLPSSSSFSSAVKFTQHSQGFLDQFTQVSSSSSSDRKHRDASAVLPFIGLTGSSGQSRNCCKNGGTCILGSFCACPPFFSGRSCQYDQRNRSCGMITHGQWVQKGCSYCRCGYGILHCFPSVFHKDCDDSQEVHWYHSSAARRAQTGFFLYLTQTFFHLLLFP